MLQSPWQSPALIKVSGPRDVSLPTLALVEKKTEIIKYNEWYGGEYTLLVLLENSDMDNAGSWGHVVRKRKIWKFLECKKEECYQWQAELQFTEYAQRPYLSKVVLTSSCFGATYTLDLMWNLILFKMLGFCLTHINHIEWDKRNIWSSSSRNI